MFLECPRGLSLHELLVEGARQAGFPISGAIDIDRVPLEESVSRYDQWLSAGYAGAMEYLVRGRDRRADPRIVFPAARSVFCVGWPYSAKPAGAPATIQGPRYARYLRSADYHTDIAARLELLLKEVATRWGKPLSWKICVDTSAVLERSWAAWAGLGWIGKNSMAIHPQLGSYFFLAEVLLSEETGEGPRPLANYCGSCTRCVDSCPTGAIVAPGSVDSNRCTSYLTLEKRGALALTEKTRRGIGPWVAGCDLCQEACPFNTKAARAPDFQEDQAISLNEWDALLRETSEEYRARVKNSSLSRVKPEQFSRNLALALANSILDSADRAAFLPLKARIACRGDQETDAHSRQAWRRCRAALEADQSG